ncbi:MAG: nicotinate-nucleotide adenylyltransferase [Coprococcus sp.]
MAKKRVGILGGTFNPVHNGHIELALQALNQFDLDKVFMMPNNKPAYKNQDEIIAKDDRAEMVKLAIRDIEGLEISYTELNRLGLTYTCETLEQLNNMYPDTKWYFIMGGDSIMYFDKWREPEKILRYATLIAAVRADIDKNTIYNKIEELQSKYADCNILFEEIRPIDISSSKLREMISEGLDVSEYMNSNVIEYIKEKKLYINV